MRRRNLPEVRHCDAGTLAVARMPGFLAAILGRRPEPGPLPVPPPSFTPATPSPRPPYRTCPPCGVEWRGEGGCWMCEPSPQPIPSQQEEP